MEEEVGQWSPDVFRLNEISAGNSLVCVAYNIFKTRKLSPAFKVSPPTFINFILAIQVYTVCIAMVLYSQIERRMANFDLTSKDLMNFLVHIKWIWSKDGGGHLAVYKATCIILYCFIV